MPRIKRKPILVTLDTETIGLDGELKRIAVYDGNIVTYGYSFEDVESVLDDLWDDGYIPHVYIHNADFDLRKIPQIFERGNVTWARTKIIGNKFARIVCKRYVIHDSFRLLPISLEKASKDFDLKHGKLDLWEAVKQTHPNQYTNHVDFLSRCDRDDPLYLEYLGYDVISLYELIEKLMELSKIPLEKFVTLLSTASMSKYLFKFGYGDLEFRQSNDDKTDYEYLTSCKAWSSKKTMSYSDISYQDCENLMRYGFYGGRTEVFTPKAIPRNGEIVAWHNDVNSLYPSVMALQRKLSGINVGLQFPIGYPDFENDPVICKVTFQNWMENQIGLGFICADVFIPMQDIPPLPVKIEKLAFVCGHVSGCWTFTELMYAIKNCGVVIEKYIYTIYFKRTHPVFEQFVNCFYKLKDEGKKMGSDSLTNFAKLILNTAYGWTALRRDDKSCFRDIKDIEKYRDTEKYITSDSELGYVEIWDTVISDTIQVQIGAYVTSYARLVLLDALRAMSNIGTVFYCDTDSIVSDHPMPPAMVDKYKLGLWDMEAELLYGLFLQPKVYTEFTTKKGGTLNKKFKGVTKKRQKELDYQFYVDLCELMEIGEKREFTVETGISRLPSLHVAQKNKRDANKLTIIDKNIKIGTAGKRIIDYQNNCSKPYYFDSLDDFNNFSFSEFKNPPNGKNLFGG